MNGKTTDNIYRFVGLQFGKPIFLRVFFVDFTIPPAHDVRHLPLHKGGKLRDSTCATSLYTREAGNGIRRTHRRLDLCEAKVSLLLQSLRRTLCATSLYTREANYGIRRAPPPFTQGRRGAMSIFICKGGRRSGDYFICRTKNEQKF